MGKRRILYIDARHGINTALLHQALEQMVTGLASSAGAEQGAAENSAENSAEKTDQSSVPGPAGTEAGAAGEKTCSDRLAAITRLAEEKGFSCSEEQMALLGSICRQLSLLDVSSILLSDVPKPVAALAAEDAKLAAKRDLLAGFSGEESETKGVSLPCALLLRVLPVAQTREICGEPLYTAVVSGSEGTPFSLLLLAGSDGTWEDIVQMESHIDHLTGEEAGLVIEELSNDRRVLDVLWLSGIGKKNRPMGLLRVLCHIRDRSAVRSLLLRHTHTLGFREQVLHRMVVDRRQGEGCLADGTRVRTKEYVIDGQWYARPESNDIRDRARETGMGAPAFRFARVRMERGR